MIRYLKSKIVRWIMKRFLKFYESENNIVNGNFSNQPLNLTRKYLKPSGKDGGHTMGNRLASNT